MVTIPQKLLHKIWCCYIDGILLLKCGNYCSFTVINSVLLFILKFALGGSYVHDAVVEVVTNVFKGSERCQCFWTCGAGYGEALTSTCYLGNGCFAVDTVYY